MAGTLTLPRLHRPPVPLLLVIAALLLFTVGLGQGSLWDQDEARYTEVARQIVTRGDPITLYANGQPWFVHPPLYLWLVAATGALFGFSEFTARIWTALFGTAGVFVTYLLGRRLYDHPTALLAGLILMTTLEYFGLARLAIFDMPLAVFMLLTLYMVLVALQSGDDPARRRRAYRWAFLWAGLATLTKGPIGLLLPAMVVGAWWLLKPTVWANLREVPWEGLILYAVIGLSWYVAETIRHGWPFVRTVVGYYMFTRFFGVVENQPGPWYYYLPVLAVGAFPWSAFLPSAIAYHAPRVRWDWRSLLLLLWVGITFLLYSLAGTKLPNYILPIYPIAAIATARLWVAAFGEESRAAGLLRWGTGLLLVAVALLALAVVLFGRTKYPQQFDALRPHLQLVAALLAAGVLLAVGLLTRRRYRQAFAALVLTMVLLFGLLVLATLPRLEPLRPMKPLALRLRAALRPEDRFIGVGMGEPSSLIYYTGHPVVWASDPASARRALCGPTEAYLVTGRAEYEGWVRNAFAGELAVLFAQGDVMVLKRVQTIPCGPP